MVKVAVIGGGISGLACARRLQQLGTEAVVFDTGKHAPGGRCSSRQWAGRVVDHAAQYLTSTTPAFTEFLRELESEKIVRKWPAGRVGRLAADGRFEADDSVERYVGVDGMGAFAASLARGLDVRQDVWVSPNGGIRREADGRWSLKAPSSPRFDHVVVAHNGKCAFRLTSSQPAVHVHTLLRADFKAQLPASAKDDARMTLNSIYSLAVELPSGAMPATFDGAFAVDSPTLRWLCSNDRKLGAAPGPTEVWTLLSTGAFGSKHKTAQEYLAGSEKEAEVVALMLGAAEEAAGLEAGALARSAVRTRLQLWGAAQPLNRWNAPFVWDSTHGIGVCGDWLQPDATAAAASTLEGAWLSGTALGDHVAAAETRGRDVGVALGADGGRFVAVGGGFGSAPGRELPPPSAVRPPRSASPRGEAPAVAAPSERLFVRNLPYSMTEDDLQTHLGGDAIIASVQLLRDDQGRSRGLARVRAASVDAAAAAVKLDGADCGGRSIKVAYDNGPPARGGRGRGRGRGAGRGAALAK